VEAQPEAVRVLVVDDEPSIVDVISMALRHTGFGVESAGTGREALDSVRRCRPHVMVLDVMLPDMDGFEVARRMPRCRFSFSAHATPPPTRCAA